MADVFEDLGTLPLGNPFFAFPHLGRREPAWSADKSGVDRASQLEHVNLLEAAQRCGDTEMVGGGEELSAWPLVTAISCVLWTESFLVSTYPDSELCGRANAAAIKETQLPHRQPDVKPQQAGPGKERRVGG